MNGNYVTIDLDAIYENVLAVKEKTGAQICGILKADAYGHGALAVAETIGSLCSFFGVASVSEARELIRGGITKPILLLGYLHPEDIPQVVALGIRPAIFTYEEAKAISEEAARQGVEAPFHFAADTGMSRIGFQVTEEEADICAKIAKLPNLVAEGIFSHYAKADYKDLTDAKQQEEKFDTFCAWLEARGVRIPIRHMDNSAGAINGGKHYDMVRCGIATYGLYPSEEVDKKALALQPALSWLSTVSCVKWLEPGRQIGYGGTFVTERCTRVATVSVGYGDGYPRALSNRFCVLIRGKRAPILGRVCMDQLMVDITDIPDVTAGEKVTLIGTDGEARISVEEAAEAAGSFNYEFVCGIARRVPRYYFRKGQCVRQVDYLLK